MADQRDTTRALEIAKKLQKQGVVEQADDLSELVGILTKMDARTGTRDPSTKRKSAKKGRRT